MRRPVLLLASMVLAVLIASGVAMAYPADLDPKFSGDGKVFTDFALPGENVRDETAYAIVVQDDGKILVGGHAEPNLAGENGGFALARYNPDGSLDNSFGDDGKVTTAADWAIYDLALQPDGKIVAVGADDFGLIRYNEDGTIDRTFGQEGRVDTDVGGDVYAVAIQADGKIVIAGGLKYAPYGVSRYNADGTLDDTFAGDGTVFTPFGGGMDTYPHDLAIQSDSKIVVAGATTNAAGDEDFGLIRYNPDGSLDDTFDQDGKLADYFTTRDDSVKALATTPDGKILAGGMVSGSGFGLARYNPDGSADGTFGVGGHVTNGPSEVHDMAVQPDGKILTLTGSSTPLVRYNANGSKDLSFGTSGGGGFGYWSASLALQTDGKAVVAGYATSGNGTYDFKLARYMGAYPDTTRPKGSVIIDGGSSVTRDRTVKLALKATDPQPYSSGVSKMRIKNAGNAWSKWLPYATSKDWSVSRGEGKKTVYVQYLDLMGNVSASAQDSITYRP